MHLYIVQHGKAESKEVNPERPLTSEGIQEIKEVLQTLKSKNIKPVQVIHSGKLRSFETALLLRDALGVDIPLVKCHYINPNDELKECLTAIETWGDTILVGHEPFLSRLMGQLLTGDEDRKVVNIQNGAVNALVYADDQWLVDWIIRP